ncbi:MAG TPA: hypothetical protein VI756_02280 [Blastocatellia bacterium]
MTHDELERAIEFLLVQQAKSSSETESLRVTVTELTGAVTALTSDVTALTGHVTVMAGGLAELTATVKSVIEEMREGFNNLIIANEVTRDLANKLPNSPLTRPTG